MERAFFGSDASYDGIFVTGVRTTGIFCRPSCRARKPRIENVEFFGTVREALFAGYRPCLRCRPLEGDTTPDWLAPLLHAVDEDPFVPLAVETDMREHLIEECLRQLAVSGLGNDEVAIPKDQLAGICRHVEELVVT